MEELSSQDLSSQPSVGLHDVAYSQHRHPGVYTNGHTQLTAGQSYTPHSELATGSRYSSSSDEERAAAYSSQKQPVALTMYAIRCGSVRLQQPTEDKSAEAFPYDLTLLEIWG